MFWLVKGCQGVSRWLLERWLLCSYQGDLGGSQVAVMLSLRCFEWLPQCCYAVAECPELFAKMFWWSLESSGMLPGCCYEVATKVFCMVARVVSRALLFSH